MNLQNLEHSAKGYLILANNILIEAVENNSFNQNEKRYYEAIGGFRGIMNIILSENIDWYFALLLQCSDYLDMHEELIELLKEGDQ
jgi:hypothetical protein